VSLWQTRSTTANRLPDAPRTRTDGSERIRRVAYLGELGRVWAVDAGTAVVAAEIMALVPEPPSPPRRAHRLAESRQERLVRWRLDAIIASTALVGEMLLIHNNPADFEAIRGAIERSPGRFPGLGPLRLVGCGRLV
jgi:hypothetical protein